MDGAGSVFAFETIGAVLGRSGFALSTEELILELAVLAAKLLDLGFELLGPMHGPSVHRLPVPDLLPQFGVLAPQFVDFLAQFEDFATKLPHQFGQISRLGGRKWVDKRAFHNKNACTQNRSSSERAIDPEKTGWAKLYTRGKFFLVGQGVVKLQDDGVAGLADGGVEDQGDFRAVGLADREPADVPRRPEAELAGVPPPLDADVLHRIAGPAGPIPTPIPPPIAAHAPKPARREARLTPLNLTTSVLFAPRMTRSKVGVVPPTWPKSSRRAIRASRWPGRFRPCVPTWITSSSSRSITETTAVFGTRSGISRWASCTAFQPLGSPALTNRPIWTR